MANIRGTFATTNLESGIKKLDIRDMIFNLQPDETPFITVLGKIPKRKAVDRQFSWFEDDQLGNYTKVNHGGGYISTDLNVVVDDSSIFQVNDIVQGTTHGEIMLITGINDGTNTLTLKRGWGTTSAGDLDDDEYLYKLGSAMAEAFTTPDSLVTAKVKKSNYVQTFSKSVTITEVADAIATYGGNRRNYERNKVGVELKRDIEAQLLWGEPKEDLTGSFPRRQTGGVRYFMGTTSPSLGMNGEPLDEDSFRGFLRDVFKYDEGERLMLTSTMVASQIAGWLKDFQMVDTGKDVTYGIKVVKYHSPVGDIKIATSRHFNNPAREGTALILNVEDLTYRFLQGLDWSLALNVQPKNAHYIQDEYSCTIGLEMQHPLKHAHIYGIAES